MSNDLPACGIYVTTVPIEGIPAGKSKLSVVHPSFGRTVEQAIEIKDGETLTVEPTNAFDRLRRHFGRRQHGERHAPAARGGHTGEAVRLETLGCGELTLGSARRAQWRSVVARPRVHARQPRAGASR